MHEITREQFDTRLYDWCVRGLSGLVIWLRQYLKAGVVCFPSRELRIVADQIVKLCDEADELGVSGGNHGNILKGLVDGSRRNFDE